MTGISLDPRPRRSLQAGATRLSGDVRLRCDELDVTRHCYRSLHLVLPELRASGGVRARYTSTVWVRQSISVDRRLRKVLIITSNGNPQGVVALGTRLVSLQAYDIMVHLNLPRTPSNIAAGNFMLELSLLSASSNSPLSTDPGSEVLAQSLRPAILTYASPIVDTASKVSQLPWYLLGWRKEAEKLEVSMMEGVKFARGWRNVPGSLRLEIQSTEPMQIYDATVKFVARFSGLRQVHHPFCCERNY